ncbi:MAG: ribose 5-phosphate isomerase B [Deltaproteobacteria bacterium]|nr:ribose 5-phosphate isomerase B [Deltaproteobacteria bacterium]
MNIIIGSDHAGFALKEHIKYFLNNTYGDVIDVGTGSNKSVDYPDFAFTVAEKVSSGEFERGILVCGSGVGMTIVANKVPGVRAVLCLDTDTAQMSRMHNDTNVLALAGRRTDVETAQTIVTTWLETEFDGGRHKRRLDKIRNIENNYRDKTW